MTDSKYSLISNDYIEKEIKHLNQLCSQSEGTVKDKLHTVLFYFERLKENLLPQQEISDEEIEKGAEWLDNPIERLSWKEGAKWYREQLKNKLG